MCSSNQASQSWFRHRIPLLLGVGLAAGLLVLPWWRNHALLRDFYDYGLVMAAVLRMSLGEHPYVDFITPIQTLHFLQAKWAEMIFGPHYLSLTYPNALLIAGAFFGMVALLRRPLGSLVALVVAAAVVASSAGQHTIVWHNAMGVIWTAGVVWLTARGRPAAAPGAWWRLGLVWALLWLGGMTKVTYQVTALAFAGLFALRDGWLGGQPWRQVALTLAGYAGFGVVAPVATELLYTGASPAQWWQNVFVTPGARLELLRPMATVKFYLHTPHDYYPPLYFPFIGAWGVAMLLALVALAAREFRKTPPLQRSWLLLGILLAGSWICGAVHLATNFDIAYMAGAMWLLLGTGLALAVLADGAGRVTRSGRIALGLAGMTLLVPAWQASWNGTRALWDSAPRERQSLVSTNDLPERYAYFRDMFITPELHESMKAFAQFQDRLTAQGVSTDRFYFVNGTEWMMRAVPGARLHGLPLWLHEGTTYGAATAKVIQQQLASGDIRAVVSLEGWNVWRHGMEWYLNTRYRHDWVGPRFHVYLARDDPRIRWRDPIMFAAKTGSTAEVRDMVESGGPFTFCFSSPGGVFLGTPRSGSLRIKAPLDRLRGELVVRRGAAAGGSPVDMVWRIVAGGALEKKTILQEEHLIMQPDVPERTLAFEAAPKGREVSLEIYLPPDERLEAGIRHLHTGYHAGTARDLPELVPEAPPAQPNQQTWSKALFATTALRAAPLRGASLLVMPDEQPGIGPHLFAHAPSVIWFRIGAQFHRLRGEFGLRPVTWTQADALNGVTARVLFYRPGHLQVLFEQELRPRGNEQDRLPQSFEVDLPGGEGWVALVFTTLDSPRNTYGHSWWRRIEAW